MRISLGRPRLPLWRVIPELADVDLHDIEIKGYDLYWQFIHAGGHGGQNVNKVGNSSPLNTYSFPES